MSRSRLPTIRAFQNPLQLFGLVLLTIPLAQPLLAADPNDRLSAAQTLLLTGRYAKAAMAFQAELAQANHAVPAAVGLARCHRAQGQGGAAMAVLAKTFHAHPDAAALPAELARLALEQGDYPLAEKHVAQSLAIDEAQVLARLVQADLLTAHGELEEADKAYAWLVDRYNQRVNVSNPDTLRWIGQAAACYARWNRLHDQFSLLVNELYPSALRLDKNYWPAHLEAGLLYLEKFNQAEAERSLQAALAINPRSPDVNAALARLAIQNYRLDDARRYLRQALLVHPTHRQSRMMQADIHIANFQPEQAATVLEAVRQDHVRDEQALGRLAAAYGILDGLSDEGRSPRMDQLLVDAERHNPHCGQVYFAAAGTLDKARRFPTAALMLERAIERMPQLVGPRGQLGLMYMRLGREDDARKVLAESHDIDPFNVRVSNSLKVLEVLETYETLETEHFILRFDGRQDALLARYAARHLEAIYPELCERLDFTPSEKTLFEIFNRARNTDGHGWFSARMVGLPNIHTIGACAGKMVAITSPSAMKKRFNWAQVLRHEFVHVLNLQQTRFNVPHWFTEALAVLLEDQPRSAAWDAMLARRVPAGQVFDLNSINLGFIRPASSEDWQMAYCQAEIYAQYLVDTYGEASLGKMLTAYRDHCNTAAAIERVCGVDVAKFEQGYQQYLQAIVAKLGPVDSDQRPVRFSQLVRMAAERPDDVDLQARLALAYLERRSTAQAGRLADQVLKRSPRHPVATLVKAKLLISIGEASTAGEKLTACLDREHPNLPVVKLLASLHYRQAEWQETETLYTLGQSHDRGNLAWTRSLAMVYLKTGQTKKLVEALTRLATASSDDLPVRKKLAQLALQAGDYQAAMGWANQALQIDVNDPSIHRMLAMALAATKQFEAAAAEYRVALELRPGDRASRLALVRVLLAAGKQAAARTALEPLATQQPDHPEVVKLQEQLERESK